MEIQLIILFIALTAGAIFAKYQSPQDAYRIFKLLPVVFLIIWTAHQVSFQNNIYAKAILVGLCFSLLGDFLLLFPSQFKAGLFSFLTGHVWYIFGFVSGNWSLPILPTVIIFILAIGIISQLYPSSGNMKLPVVFYILVIGAMGISAFGRLETLQTPSALIGAIGAIFLMVSDCVLGWNKFKKSFPAAEAIILSTYYLGQGLITYSIL